MHRYPLIAMFPPIPSIKSYGITELNGFLPPDLPLERLPGPYYAPWEKLAADLQALLLSRRLRDVVHTLPVLSTSRLQSEAEWRRAYVVLGFLTHSYIWGGNQPAEVSVWRLLAASRLTDRAEDPASDLHSFAGRM